MKTAPANARPHFRALIVGGSQRQARPGNDTVTVGQLFPTLRWLALGPKTERSPIWSEEE